MNMFKQLTPSIQGLILDMDGVLWKDSAPIGNLPDIFNNIQAQGLKVVLATNNATNSVKEYLDKIQRFGVELEPWQIVTSAMASAHALVKAFPEKGAVFIVGENGLITELKENGFKPLIDPDDESPVVAVIAGIDRTLNYEKLRRATFHIRAGVPFYGTNPDSTFPTPLGLVPGAGSIIAALQTASGVKPIIIGKPSPYMFDLSMERMKLSNRETLIVGDRLETDIAGGQALGARTALVLSGVSTRQQVSHWNPQPDLIANDLTQLISF
jgi:4-nitrophenyl phosphatase